MFGLFKKRKPEPSPLPSRTNNFQPFFATKWIHSALTSSIAGFSGAVLCGDGTKVVTNLWKKIWSSSYPNELVMPSDGLTVDAFQVSDRLLVLISFPPPTDSGGAYFGVVVLGPCDDPNWGPEARQNLPFRYFVLFRAASGTTVEDWTTDPPVPLGHGPDPQSSLFVEWVLNHAMSSAGIATVAVRSGTEDVAAAIARARSELPAVLQRFVAGELHDMGFTVKVPIIDGEFTEHFWLSDTSFADGQFSGVIDADPQSVSTVKRGERWTASVEDVTDWMYVYNKKMHGNYTLRTLLPKLPPHEAAKYRALLADEGA